MKIQLIRNATLRIEYAQHRFVIDPFFAEKQSRPSFTGKSRNPLVDLPCSPQAVMADAEMTLVSHLHADHFDPVAQELLAKERPIFCQPGDEVHIQGMGFQQVVPITDRCQWQGITIVRTEGQHGSGEVLAQMGHTSGFIFQADDVPTVFWAGDTILNDTVAAIIEQFRPDIIITHSSGAVWGDGVLIVMDAAQTVEVCRAAPGSVVIATHMESLDHGTVSRADLRRYADEQGILSSQLLIPEDGEQLVFAEK